MVYDGQENKVLRYHCWIVLGTRSKYMYSHLQIHQWSKKACFSLHFFEYPLEDGNEDVEKQEVSNQQVERS